MAPWAKSPHSSPPRFLSSPQCPVLARGGCQRQNGPLFCVPIFPTPGACLSAESLFCCPAPAQCLALSLPPPLTPTPYQLMGVGRGPKARSLVQQPGDEVVSGELYPLSPSRMHAPVCAHADRIPQACSQSRSGQLRRTGGGRLLWHYPGSK